MRMESIGKRRLAAVVLFSFLAALAFGQTVDLTLLATSDLHNNYLNYDYFSDLPTEQYGLVKLASAVKAEREAGKNVLLVDNGDNIQGNPFGEYLSKNPPTAASPSPIMTLMNAAGSSGCCATPASLPGCWFPSARSARTAPTARASSRPRTPSTSARSRRTRPRWPRSGRC